jgi:hypothetical protein
VLLIAAVAHDILAKLVYAQQFRTAGGTPEQVQSGAQTMYYGGQCCRTPARHHCHDDLVHPRRPRATTKTPPTRSTTTRQLTEDHRWRNRNPAAVTHAAAVTSKAAVGGDANGAAGPAPN